MKKSLLLSFLFLFATSAFADVCDDAVSQYNSSVSQLLDKRLMAFEDYKNAEAAFTQLKVDIGSESCYKNAVDQVSGTRNQIKNKRIETIERYMKLGIKEEGGRPLSSQLADLTSKKIETVTVVTPPVINNKPIVYNSSKCTDRINQNDAVNLENVRNQDGVGWCYAYTAADLLSFKLNKKISAVSLYDSGQDIENDVFGNLANGGDITSAIKHYIEKKNGLCLESDLPSSDFKFCQSDWYKDFLNTLLSAARDNRFQNELETNQCFGRDLEKAFPGINLSVIANQINRSGSKKLIESLYDLECKAVSFPGIRVSSVDLNKPRYQVDQMLKAVDEQLDKGSVASIAYDYNKLNNKEGYGAHGSIIVGRRTNPDTGACEYLVRNSWGKDCDQNEGTDLSCHKNCSNGNCRYSGHFWVSDKLLKGSLIGVTYLQ